MRLVSLCFASLLAVTGCPGDDSGGNETEGGTAGTSAGSSNLEPCTPGESRACDCAGMPGTQECNGAGTAFGPCLCTSPTTTAPMTTTAPPPDDDDGPMDTTDGDTTMGTSGNPTTGMATDTGSMTTGMTDSGGTTTGMTSMGGSSGSTG